MDPLTLKEIFPKIRLDVELKKIFEGVKVQPCESRPWNPKIKNKKKSFIIVCCGDGNFKLRDVTQTFEEKLDSYYKKYTEGKIDDDEYKKLKSNAIKEESQDICSE